MSKQTISNVIAVASSYTTKSVAELKAAKKSIQSVFESVVNDSTVELRFIDVAFHTLKLVNLTINADSSELIEEKRKEVVCITNSLRYKLCNANGVI